MDYLEIHGVKIPALGFGTAGLRGAAGVEAVRDALEIGYRHIDTARMYRNESDVGQGIKESKVPRDEVFVTTKIVRDDLVGTNVGKATDESLKALDVDYIDLLLIHSPSTTVPLKETLAAMVAQKEAGKIRNIGVSNFRVAQLEEAMAETEIFTNQVPYQIGRTQRGLCKIAAEQGIMLTAYSPLRGAGASNPIVLDIASAHGKSPQQVALRWLLQQTNVSPIPRSSSPEHRRSNFDVFDFELTDDEMQKISSIADSSAG